MSDAMRRSGSGAGVGAALGLIVGLLAAAIDQHGRIGSITKTFTVTAVLQQVAAGTLELESTIGEILPDLAARYPAIEDITVEQLAGMTSGIQD